MAHVNDISMILGRNMPSLVFFHVCEETYGGRMCEEDREQMADSGAAGN